MFNTVHGSNNITRAWIGISDGRSIFKKISETKHKQFYPKRNVARYTGLCSIAKM